MAKEPATAYAPTDDGDSEFRDFFAAAPVALCVVAPDGRILAANEDAIELLGYAGRETSHPNIAELIAEPELLDELLDLLHRGEPLREFGMGIRIDHRTVRYISVNSNTQFDHAGAVVASRWALRDITSQQRAEQLATLLAAVVDSSHDAIVSKRLDGTILSWNRSAERLFGYTSDEAVGRSIRMIVPADRQEEEDEVLRKLRRGEAVEHFETVRRRKDGKLIPVSLTISPVRNREGRIVGASKVARDISEQKAAEEELRRSLAAKDEFLGLVSHELRTPLTTLKGTANVLRRHEAVISQPDREQALTDIEGGADQLLRIVENMLTLARADNMTGNDMEPVLLGRLVAQAVNERRQQMHTHQLTFVSSPEVLPVLANPGYLRLILTNLLNNASKYSPRGSEIVVKVEREDDHAHLIVEDSGIGIPEDELSDIFVPFHRSPRARAHASGIGLGLTVCKRLIEIQGGSIEASGRPEGGPAFRVTLPLMDEVGE